MRYVDINNNLFQARNSAYSFAFVQPIEVTKPGKLVEIIRSISQRIGTLEGKVPPEYLEFERNTGTGGALLTLAHGFKAPVRYFVTHWTRQAGGAYPTAAPVLVADASSTEDTLILRSHVAGKAVIRIEPVQGPASI